jgi:hypothetical protein
LRTQLADYAGELFPHLQKKIFQRDLLRALTGAVLGLGTGFGWPAAKETGRG